MNIDDKYNSYNNSNQLTIFEAAKQNNEVHVFLAQTWIEIPRNAKDLRNFVNWLKYTNQRKKTYNIYNDDDFQHLHVTY